MKSHVNQSLLMSAIIISNISLSNAASLQIEEVLVTAQKRSENVNEVPMSISALSGENLASKGFSDTEDLAKMVPGFTATKTNSNTPVFTLRGVGLYLYDSGVGASPAVSVYIDEVGLPSPAMTSGISFDLERVEVLKGPQGTLFGQNATGGAINFIAAKPTVEPSAGISVSIDQHNKNDVEAFVSGSLSETLLGRIAIGSVQGGAWQESASRPNDKLGDKDQFQARVLLDWSASDSLSLKLNVTTATDESDTQGARFTKFHPTHSSGSHPNSAAQAALSNPNNIISGGPEKADWTPGTNYANNSFDLMSLRVDKDLNDTVTLTSLTAWQEVDIDMTVDQDGAVWDNLIINPVGNAETFSQELRISGSDATMNWVAGINYEVSDIRNNLYYDTDLSANYSFGPGLAYQVTFAENTSDTESKAVFGSLDYNITDRLTGQAGIRYTESSRDATNCTFGDQVLSDYVNKITELLGPGSAGFVAGDCIMLEASSGPNAVPTGEISQSLNENNTSWRVGLTYTTEDEIVTYGNISRGFKAGTIIPAAGLTRASYFPTNEEQLTAFETGFKASLFDSRAQLNGAIFLYDYVDKQVPFIEKDPAFGALPALANVPKSEVKGAEIQLLTVLAEGLDLSLAATYLDTEVSQDHILDTTSGLVNVKGSVLPNTPELSFVGDLQYRRALTSDVDMVLGTSINYVGESLSRFQNAAEAPPVLPSYTLVDIRAGFASPEDAWLIQFWGRNVTNKLYYTTDNISIDTSYRYVGQGANYGLTFNYKI